MTRAPAGYRHLLRVRLGGPTGPAGKLLECESRTTGRHFWKVRLDNGEWEWPERRGGVVVDGPGDAVNPECRECGLPFIYRAGSGELICEACNQNIFGGADRASEPPPVPLYDYHPRRKWFKRGKR